MTECPTANEVGIRSSPVCVEGVDTSQFDIISAPNVTDTPAVTIAVAVCCSIYSLILLFIVVVLCRI